MSTEKELGTIIAVMRATSSTSHKENVSVELRGQSGANQHQTPESGS